MKESQYTQRLMSNLGGGRYFQRYVDEYDDGELISRTIICTHGEHTYMYVFTPTTAWDCMERAFDHALGDELNLTLGEAEALSLTMEEIIDDKGIINM